jgi:hypothetical protein
MTLIDPNGRESPTVSVRGAACLELARAGIVAVAIAELDPFDVPIHVCHGVLLVQSLASRPPHRTAAGRDRLVKNLDFTTEGGCRTLAR